jgi:predicted RNA-binding Zn-ribbon protein involved in translation (DUF1610 family)
MIQHENTNEHCPFCGQHLPDITKGDMSLTFLSYDDINEAILFDCPQCNNEIAFVYYIDNDGHIQYESTEYDDGEPDEEGMQEYYDDQRKEDYRDKMYDKYEQEGLLN